MPPYNSVKCLQSLALEQVCKYVLDITLEMKKNQIASRVYFLNNVHAWARTDILARTKVLLDNGREDHEIWDKLKRMYGSDPYLGKLTYRFGRWLVILDAMLDIGVYQLPPIIVHGEREVYELVTVLRRSNSHLKTLNVTFQNVLLFGTYYTPTVSTSLISHERFIHKGLASRLVSLKLEAICDNSILKTIGEHALCLKHLDVSGSHINEYGIKHLLFKRNVHVETNNVPIGKLCQRLSQLYDDKSSLNSCCFTLEKLGIQVPFRSEDAALLMILACVKSLKVLCGDFNIGQFGDKLLKVWENSPKPRTFQLIELHDMQLTVKKIYAYEECLPHLKKLYTQLFCLPQDSAVPHHGLMFWHRVKTLDITIGLNDMTDFHFYNIVNNYGENLSELVIQDPFVFLDQECTYLDVAKILTCCPNLILLKGYLQIVETPIGQYPTLKALELNMPNKETTNWFFVNCPGIEELVTDSRHLYWNEHVLQNLPLIMCNLKRLEICLNNNDPFTNIQLVIDFIDKCSKLQHLGRIEYCNIDKRFVKQIKKYVKKMNYELNIY